MLSVSLLSPCGLPRSRHLVSVLILRSFFSASAKMKEKNQSSKEAQEKTVMRTSTNSTPNTSIQNAPNHQGKSFSNNLVILTGNLGADAAFFGVNDSAASFRMATKNTFGEKEYVEWHSVVAFRELAKEVVEKCTKGRFIRVHGYLHSTRIGDGDAAQYKVEVVATRIKYLDRKK
jgi:Single-strand binding protein family